jgi:opacity protein-like surface antigen
VATGLFATIVCAAAALNAEEETAEDEYSRPGWLLGAGGSYAFETFEDDVDLPSFMPSLSLSADDSFSIHGRAGYRCHPRFSAEVEFEWVDGFDADISQSGVGKVAKVDIEPIVVTANIKGYLLTGRYQPFLLVGGGFMRADEKVRDTAAALGLSGSDHTTRFAARFGGGVDVYATRHIVVTAEAGYVLPTGSLEYDYVTIGMGLQYRF